MNDLELFLKMIDTFTIDLGAIQLGAYENDAGKWHLSFTTFVPYKIGHREGDMLAFPSPELKSVLQKAVGKPVEFIDKHTLACDVAQIGPALIDRIGDALEGDQSVFWMADPEILQDIEDDPGVPRLTRIERR